nr:hypothetical protein [Tanacetum cinerariifolium]
TNIADLSKHTNRYISPVLTQKVFENMQRVGKGFSGVETPLFETMLAVRDIAEEAEAQVPDQGDDVHEHVAEEVATAVVPPTPTSPSPSSPVIPSSPPYQSPCPPQPQDAKARVKKLEKLNKVKSSKLRWLKKDAEVEGRHTDKQAEIYNIDLDHSSKVLSMQEDDTEPKTLTITVAPTVSTKRRKGVVIRDPEEELHTDTPAETPTVKDKGKGILIEDPKPMKKKDQVEMDAEYAKKLQEELDKEHKEAYKQIDWNVALDHVQSKEPQFDANMKFLFKTREEIEKKDDEIIKSINETPAQKAAKRRKLSKEAQEADDLKKRLEIVQGEDDDVFVEATPLAQKVHVVDYQDAIWSNPKSVYGLALVKRWKMLTSCGVHVIILSTVQLFLLVERRYPLLRFTLEQLVNVARLQVEEESKMSLE